MSVKRLGSAGVNSHERRRKHKPQWHGWTLGTATAVVVAIVVGVAASLHDAGHDQLVNQTGPNVVQNLLRGFISQAYAYTLVAPPNFNSIQMLSPSAGWGEGYDKDGHFQLIKTSDGGAGWNKVTLPASPPQYDVSLNEIGQPGYVRTYFMNASTGWIAWIDENTKNMNVMQTKDGGQHWALSHTSVPTYAQTVANLDFVNPDMGWLLAASTAGSGQEQKFLYATHDGGQSWMKVADSAPKTGQLTNLGTSTDLKFAANGIDGWFATGDPASSTVNLSRTADGGKTWRKVPITVPSGYEAMNPTSVSAPVLQGDQGVMSVTFSGQTGDRQVVYHTSDGGKTWSPTVLQGKQWGTLDFVDTKQGFAYKFDGHQILGTRDGGRTWQALTPLSSTDLKQYPMVSQLNFVNASTGWILLQSADYIHSKLLKTVDGGQSWFMQ